MLYCPWARCTLYRAGRCANFLVKSFTRRVTWECCGQTKARVFPVIEMHLSRILSIHVSQFSFVEPLILARWQSNTRSRINFGSDFSSHSDPDPEPALEQCKVKRIQNVGCAHTSKTLLRNFMSFCRILSTLCSHVVFHNIPHFSRGRQKSGTQSTSYNRPSGTKCKTPLLFVPVFWNPRKILSIKWFILYFIARSFPQKSAELFYVYVSIIKLTKETRRRVSRGRD